MAQSLLVPTGAVSREMFNGLPSYDSTHGTVLTSFFSGTMFRRPDGPRTSGIAAPGWSAEIRTAGTFGYYPCGSNGQANSQWIVGMADFYMLNYNAGTSNWLYLVDLYTQNGTNDITAAIHTGDGHLYILTNQGGGAIGGGTGYAFHDTNQVIPLNTWFNIALCRQNETGGASNLAAYYTTGMTTGGALSQVYTTTGVSNQTINLVGFGLGSTGGGSSGACRMGNAGVYTLASSLSEVVYPGDVTPPDPAPKTYYFAPGNANASDNNSGTDPANPCSSGAELQSRLAYSGVLPRTAPSAPTVSSVKVASGTATVAATSHGFTTGDQVAIVGAVPPWLNGGFTITVTDANHFTYQVKAAPPEGTGTQTASGTITCRKFAYGDTVVIDSTQNNTPFDFGAYPLSIYAQGLRLQLLGSPVITRQLPTSGWVQYDSVNYPHIWKTTDGSATDLDTCVVWEPGFSWLNHPLGANIAAVASALNGYASGTGGFWTDGGGSSAILYLVCSGGGSPNAADANYSGKVYTRSRNTAGGNGFITVLTNDVDIQGDGATVIQGSTLLATNNGLGVAYLVQFGTTAGGACRVANIILTNGSSHCAGSSSSQPGGIYLRENVIYGVGAYLTAGTSSGYFYQDVDYSGSSTLGSVYCYTNCKSIGTFATIGSNVPQEYDFGGGFWISHPGNGATTPFANGYFLNTFVTGGLIDYQGVSGTIYFSGGASGGSIMGSTTVVNQSKSVFQPWCPNSAGTTTVTNSVVAPQRLPVNISNFVWAALQDATTTIYQGCTFDLTGVPSSSNALVLFYHQYASAGCTLKLQDCTLKTDPTKPYQLLGAFRNVDTLTIDHNCWAPNSSGVICGNYNDGSTTADRTFSQWQTLTFDTGSLNVDPALLSYYVPSKSSPVIGLGPTLSSLAGLADYQGSFRPGSGQNVDAGAVQHAVGTAAAACKCSGYYLPLRI